MSVCGGADIERQMLLTLICIYYIYIKKNLEPCELKVLFFAIRLPGNPGGVCLQKSRREYLEANAETNSSAVRLRESVYAERNHSGGSTIPR